MAVIGLILLFLGVSMADSTVAAIPATAIIAGIVFLVGAIHETNKLL